MVHVSHNTISLTIFRIHVTQVESILSQSEGEAAALSKYFPSGEHKPVDPSQTSKKGPSAPAKSKTYCGHG